jgi:DNA polymerase-4
MPWYNAQTWYLWKVTPPGIVEYHTKIINVMREYCNDVVPKSIDEAIVNFSNYENVDPRQMAMNIKRDILTKVGDWLTCSVGIAPNAFLAKLASVRGKKRDGLMMITPQNIDSVLSELKLGRPARHRCKHVVPAGACGD